jgi:hypothetical protein
MSSYAVNRLFGAHRQNGPPTAVPMDAYRSGEAFLVMFDLPGVAADSIELTVEQNVLIVHATRTRPGSDTVEMLASERHPRHRPSAPDMTPRKSSGPPGQTAASPGVPSRWHREVGGLFAVQADTQCRTAAACSRSSPLAMSSGDDEPGPGHVREELG